MDSFLGIDPTLPIDLDGSANPDFLPDITGNHFECADGSVPMLAKSNGRMSPIRARTMKEYDQHIAELKKENFSLKLRIYFLEERMQQKFGNEEDVFKTNIELKVEVESQKRELLDKHELIQKASAAMESLTSKHNQDLKNLANQYESELKRLKEENERGLQQECENVVEELRHANETVEKLRAELDCQIENEKGKLQEIQELKGELEGKKNIIKRLDENCNKLRDEVPRLKQELEQTKSKCNELSNQVAKLQTELSRKERDIHDVVDDQKETISKLMKEKQNLECQLNEKIDTVEKFEVLRDIMTNEIKKLENKLKENEDQLKSSSEQNEIVGKVLRGLQHKNDNLTAELSKCKDEIDALKEEIQKLNVEKHEVETAKAEELMIKDGKIEQLSQAVQEHEQRLENLMRSLGKKDGELGNFKQLLSQAQDALKQSEVAVEILQEELLKEKQQAQESKDKQAAHYQNLFDDYEKQLKNKDVLIEQMSERLDTKDKQLNDCMDFIQADKKDKNSTLENLLKKMEERLKNKDEEIKTLEDENDEKDKIIRELSKKLQALQRSWRENQHADVPEDILEDMNKLKREIAELREQQRERPVNENNIVPELIRLLKEQLKEMHNLSESLKREHQIFITLNARGGEGGDQNSPADHAAVFQRELGAVQALRQQLEDNVLRNSNLWELLQHQVKTSTQEQASGDQENQSKHFVVFDKAVGTSPLRQRDDDKVRYVSSQTSPIVTHTRSEIYTQTSPREQHHTLSEYSLHQTNTSQDGSPYITERSELFTEESPEQRLAVVPRLDVTDSIILAHRKGTLLEPEAIAAMSSVMLRKLVSQLQEDLVSALKQNHQLQQHIFSIDIDEIPVSETVDELQADLQYLKEETNDLKMSLSKKTDENEILRLHLGLEKESELDYSSLPNLHNMQNEVKKLKSQLNAVLHLNEVLKKQMNSVTSCDDSQLGFNQELILEMASEIEKLKTERETYLQSKNQTQTHSVSIHTEIPRQDASVQVNLSEPSFLRPRLTISSDEVDSTLHSSDDAKPSRIPRLKNRSSQHNIHHPMTSDTSHENHPAIIQCQLKECRKQLEELKSKLSATEETVRYQTQKMKYYKKLLQQAGLGLVDCRSVNELCLVKSGTKSFHASFECLYVPNKSDLSLTVNGNRLSVPVDQEPKRTFSQGNLASSQPCQATEETATQKVRNLEEQLELCKYENIELQEKLSELQQSGSDSVRARVLDTDSVEIASLRKQLMDAHNGNMMLKQQLEELSTFMSEMVQLNSNEDQEENNTANVSNMSSIQEYLDQSLDVLKYGTASNSSSAIHEKYCKALQQIQLLKQQQQQSQQVHKKDKEQLTKPDTAEGPSLMLTRQIGYKGHVESDTDSLRSTSPSDGRPKQSSVGNCPLITNRTQVTRENRSAESDVVVVYKQTDENYGRPIVTSAADSSLEHMRHRLMSGNSSVGMTNGRGTLDQMRQRYSSVTVDGGHSVVSSAGNATHSEKESSTPSVSDHISNNGYGRFDTGAAVAAPVVSGNNMEEASLLYSSQYDSKFEFSRLYDSTLNGLDKRHDEARDQVDSAGTASKSLTDVLSDVSSAQELARNAEIKHLQSRLSAVENMNQTLQEELSLYETLCASAGLEKDRSQSCTLPSDSFTGNDTLNLKEHLAEIRALRLKLEKSLLDNQKLNEQLMLYQQSGDMHYECDLRLKKLQDIIVGLQSQLTQKEQSCTAYLSQCEIKLSDLQDHVEMLNSELTQKENSYHSHCKQQEDKITELRERIATLQREAAEKETSSGLSRQQYEKQISDLQNQVEMLKHDLSEREKEYSVNQKQYETTIRKLQSCVKNLQHELSKSEETADLCRREMDSRISEQLASIKSLQHELAHVETAVKEKQTLIVEKEKIINEYCVCVEKHEQERSEKETEMKKKEKQMRDLELKCQKLEQHLKKASKEIKRLQSDTHSLVEQVEEKSKLNKTLKLELSVHERLENDSTCKNDNKSDIRELLTEIRHLRVQLEKSIDTNNTLRQTIESLLKQQASQDRSCHNRNDSPTGSHTTDATDGRPSPDPHHSMSKKQSRNETHLKPTQHGEQLAESTHSRNGHSFEDSAISEHSEPHSSDSTSHDMMSHQNSVHTTTSSRERSPVRQENSWFSSTGLDDCRTSPRRHLAAVENIRYWFDKQPSHKDMPKVQIDTDIRQLFVIGKLDDYEKMRKENDLSLTTLRGMEARVRDRINRLKILSTCELIKSVEYSTLKELSMSLENLSICLGEENRLIAAFWISELPPINSLGEFFDPKLASENDVLKRELVRLKSKYDFANRMIQSTEERLHATNKRRENMEHAVFKQLSKTAKVLGQANANMLRSAEDAGYSTKR